MCRLAIHCETWNPQWVFRKSSSVYLNYLSFASPLTSAEWHYSFPHDHQGMYKHLKHLFKKLNFSLWLTAVIHKLSWRVGNHLRPCRDRAMAAMWPPQKEGFFQLTWRQHHGRGGGVALWMPLQGSPSLERTKNCNQKPVLQRQVSSGGSAEIDSGSVANCKQSS